MIKCEICNKREAVKVIASDHYYMAPMNVCSKHIKLGAVLPMKTFKRVGKGPKEWKF